MKTNLLTLIITLVVGVILAGSLLAPVIGDTSQGLEATEKTQANITSYLDETEKFTLFQDHTDYTVSLDGEPLTLAASTPILITDKVMIMALVVSSSVTTNPTMGVWAEGIAPLTISGLTWDITITLEDGTLSLTYGSPATTSTFDVEYAYILSPDNSGDFAIMPAAYTTSTQLNDGDSMVFFNNGGWWSTSTAPIKVTAADGTVTASGKTYAYDDQTTGTDITLTLNFKTEKYDNLILESSSPSGLLAVVPSTFTAYEPNEYSALLGAIPILVIVGILMIGVGAITLNRRD